MSPPQPSNPNTDDSNFQTIPFKGYIINGKKFLTSGDQITDIKKIMEYLPDADVKDIANKIVLANASGNLIKYSPEELIDAYKEKNLPAAKKVQEIGNQVIPNYLKNNPNDKKTLINYLADEQFKKVKQSQDGTALTSFAQGIGNSATYGGIPAIETLIDIVTPEKYSPKPLKNGSFLDNLKAYYEINKQVAQKIADENPKSTAAGSIIGSFTPTGAESSIAKLPKTGKFIANNVLSGIRAEAGIKPDASFGDLALAGAAAPLTAAMVNPVISKAVSLPGSVLNKFGEWFSKGAVKETPTMAQNAKDLLGMTLNKFLYKTGIKGNPDEIVSQALDKKGQYIDELNDIIKNKLSDKTESVQDTITKLNDLKDKYKGNINFDLAKTQIDKMIDMIKKDAQQDLLAGKEPKFPIDLLQQYKINNYPNVNFASKSPGLDSNISKIVSSNFKNLIEQSADKLSPDLGKIVKAKNALIGMYDLLTSAAEKKGAQELVQSNLNVNDMGKAILATKMINPKAGGIEMLGNLVSKYSKPQTYVAQGMKSVADKMQYNDLLNNKFIGTALSQLLMNLMQNNNQQVNYQP